MANYNLVQMVFDRQALSPDEDVAVTTCHIREVVQGAPDILPVTDAGRDNFDGRVNSWWSSMKGHVTPKISFLQLRYYDVPDVAGADMGDPVRITPVNQPGTAGSNALPPQNSLTITYRTDKRLTWGRMYIPGIAAGILDGSGRILPSICDEIANATHALTSRAGTGAALVVFSRKEWTHHDPQTIQVDDIIDIQRSRRFEAAHHRGSISAG